ncbi:ROK family protein [Microbacterium sp. XT11]|uniref:ROK family protein n=1 Tax=Microbacterium sp. XT11 TaxID=367477 RepID=UPI000742DE98|nr:ROK family protein [Microbacterium sp. XT11]ALX66137.1 ROK family protein [Microbacterium sp. XT11]
MELCIDFGGTEIKLAVIADGRVIASESIPVAGTTDDLAAAAVAARTLVDSTGRAADAVGIAVPGVVDPSTGRMLHANAKYDHLRDRDLSSWSHAQFGVTAAVENDARAALVGETSSGCASGERDAVLVTLGTGIGTAAMMDGVALRGRTGHAGILGGHVTVDLDGPTCPCGNVGCGEALASAWALRASTGLRMTDLFTASAPATASDAASSHAPTAMPASSPTPAATPAFAPTPTSSPAPAELTALRDRFLHTWGATVVTLVHAYDPAVVVLSGGILRAGAAVAGPIETYVRAHLWPSMTAPRFLVPPEPELSVARGLSVLARSRDARPRQEDQ